MSILKKYTDLALDKIVDWVMKGWTPPASMYGNNLKSDTIYKTTKLVDKKQS